MIFYMILLVFCSSFTMCSQAADVKSETDLPVSDLLTRLSFVGRCEEATASLPEYLVFDCLDRMKNFRKGGYIDGHIIYFDENDDMVGIPLDGNLKEACLWDAESRKWVENPILLTPEVVEIMLSERGDAGS